MSAEDAVAGGLLGGIIGGSIGYKAGFDAGYRKKEQEDAWTLATLRSQLAAANQAIENLQKESLRLKAQRVLPQNTILHRVKGVLTK